MRNIKVKNLKTSSSRRVDYFIICEIQWCLIKFYQVLLRHVLASWLLSRFFRLYTEVELVILSSVLPFTLHLPCFSISLLLSSRWNTNSCFVLDHDSAKGWTSVELFWAMIMGTTSDGWNVSSVSIHSMTLKIRQWASTALIGIGKLMSGAWLVVVFVVGKGWQSNRVLGLTTAVAGSVAVGTGADGRCRVGASEEVEYSGTNGR